MTHVSETELRRNLSRILDEAVDTRAPVVVTHRSGKGNVVLIAEAEFAGWQPTAHLPGSPRNAGRLLRGIRESGRDGGAATVPEPLDDAAPPPGGGAGRNDHRPPPAAATLPSGTRRTTTEDRDTTS